MFPTDDNLAAALNKYDTRGRFPALSRMVDGHPIVYLDTAATALRPAAVIDAGCDFCRLHDGNPHRGLHTLSNEATVALEATRDKVSKWVGAPSRDAVVFTRNATYALNLVARGLAHRLRPGDEIVLTEMEHHANLVPWLTMAKERGLKVRYIPIDEAGELSSSDHYAAINRRTKVVSAVHVSNVLGTINPVERLAERAHQVGALMVVDAAQSVGHLPFSFKDLGADFAVFSAHKCYGPTGLGFLIGKEESLEMLEPLETGGDMIEHVSFEGATWAPVPRRFEAGTPNASAAVSFAKSIEFMEELGAERLRTHDLELTAYALKRLAEVKGLRVLGPRDPERRSGLVSFVDPLVHPHDLATILDERGVAVRAGHHCAQPLHRRLGIGASNRASFGVYSQRSDVDALVMGILDARKVFQR
jgi:cysteine desulfurase/selenocysteine lyase